MSFGILEAEKSAHVHPFPLHVAEALQDVFGERGFDSVRHFRDLAQGPRENIVIVESVLELLHEPDGLALNDLAGSERAICEDELPPAGMLVPRLPQDLPVRRRAVARFPYPSSISKQARRSVCSP